MTLTIDLSCFRMVFERFHSFMLGDSMTGEAPQVNSSSWHGAMIETKSCHGIGFCLQISCKALDCMSSNHVCSLKSREDISEYFHYTFWPRWLLWICKQTGDTILDQASVPKPSKTMLEPCQVYFLLTPVLSHCSPQTPFFNICIYMAVCQNLVPLVNIKIAGKWMWITP